MYPASLVAEQRRLSLTGPRKDEISCYRAKSLQEYSDICSRIVTNHPTESHILYRGQATEYFLPNSEMISVLPSGGRPGAILPKADSQVAEAFHRYWEATTLLHARTAGMSPRTVRAIARLLRGHVHGFSYHWSVPAVLFLEQYNSLRLNPIVREAALQHYGYPTLNLDVTFSPWVALLFACYKFRLHTGTVGAQLNDGTGIVYAFAAPASATNNFQAPATGFRGAGYINLFSLFNDNDSRPRRQAGAVLTDAGDLREDHIVQLNVYSNYILAAIKIDPCFLHDPEVAAFLATVPLGRLLPGLYVDKMYGALHRADPFDIPRYGLMGLGASDPAGRLEWLNPRRIVLLGGEAQIAHALLSSSWFARSNMIEIWTEEQCEAVLSQSAGETLDAVVICGENSLSAAALARRLVAVARRAGRVVVFIDSSERDGAAIPNYRPIPTLIGDEIFNACTDSHDSDAALQDMLLAGLQRVSEERARRWLCDSTDWRRFADWSNSSRKY